MKHLKKGRKFGRKRDQRKALLRILAANLITQEKIKTTEAKAKELRPFIEKLITKGKLTLDPQKRLAAIKGLASALPEKAREKMTKELGKRYENRKGGYTRIVKLTPRKSDGAKMAIIELVK